MLSTILGFGMEGQQASKASRASHNEGGVVGLVVGIDPGVAAATEDMGHSTKASDRWEAISP